MTRKILLVTLAASLALAAPAAAATRTVTVGDDFFVREGSAAKLTVAKNTTVKWVWRGESPHDVTVTKGPVKFNSTTKESGSYSKKVTRAGTYSIICTIHAPDMKMTLTVKSGK